MKVTLHSGMSREKYRCHIGEDYFYLITLLGTPTRLLVYPSVCDPTKMTNYYLSWKFMVT